MWTDADCRTRADGEVTAKHEHGADRRRGGAHECINLACVGGDVARLRLWNVWHVAIEFGRAVYFHNSRSKLRRYER